MSGLAEPLGALVVYVALRHVIDGIVVGAMLAAVTGTMVRISFDELLPTAREYGEGQLDVTGVVSEMAPWLSNLR